MNIMRTGILLAVMTALFMGIGYLLGGTSGMMIAFLIAAAMNFFNYWKSDQMVLKMHNAVEIDERNSPEYYRQDHQERETEANTDSSGPWGEAERRGSTGGNSKQPWGRQR